MGTYVVTNYYYCCNYSISMLSCMMLQNLGQESNVSEET